MQVQTLWRALKSRQLVTIKRARLASAAQGLEDRRRGASTLVQCAVRACLARWKVGEMRAERNAALVMQCVARCRQSRAKVGEVRAEKARLLVHRRVSADTSVRSVAAACSVAVSNVTRTPTPSQLASLVADSARRGRRHSHPDAVSGQERETPVHRDAGAAQRRLVYSMFGQNEGRSEGCLG